MAFEQEERDVLRFLRKVLLNVAAWVASPFLMLAFLFFLLEKPLLWSLICLAVASLLLVAALVVWLVVRARLRDARRTVELVADSDIFRPRP